MNVATIKFENGELIALMFALETAMATGEGQKEGSFAGELGAVHSRIQQAWLEIRGAQEPPPPIYKR